MAGGVRTVTLDGLINYKRFTTDTVLQFLLYMPFGLLLVVARSFLGLALWIAAIILPDKQSVRHLLSAVACCTFGIYVQQKGRRDKCSSVLVANYVSAMDSLASSFSLGTISLRKWKLPPFFASTLGIRNAAQFARKQHFSDSLSQPVLIQPEGGPTNGMGLLQFTDWPFQVAGRVQPAAITVDRIFTNVTVHRPSDSVHSFPWSDALWYLWSPITVYTITLLSPVERGDDDEPTFHGRLREVIANSLKVEATNYRWEELCRRWRRARPGTTSAGTASRAGHGERAISLLAAQVKEVLPTVPMRDILRDLAQTKSVDVTITNFLEGLTPYSPEEIPEPQQSTSRAQPRYITPEPMETFPKNAKYRQISFQDKKAQMVAAARRRYIEKHGINIALIDC